jgi:lipid-binding SYLF domain-containing protein
MVPVLFVLNGCQNGEGGDSGAGGSGAAMQDNTLPSIGAQAALNSLCQSNPAAAALAKNAKGVLVFPEVTKGGFVVGGFHGEGRLIRNGKVTAAYNTTGASYGLQAGVQQFAYALFFMNEADLSYLDKSEGWEIGVGPNITVVDQGLATSLTTTTAREGVYCFFFDQKGLMAGMGLQGSKITRVSR